MKQIYTFNHLSQIQGLVHGFSTTSLGSMHGGKKGTDAIRPLSISLGIHSRNIVGMEQVHGNSISYVTESAQGKIMESTDGLWSDKTDMFLYGTFADCVPVLFYDTHLHFFGVTHSGWRGTYHEIVRHSVLDFIKHGSDPKDILVGIGPSIRSCCYAISSEIADLFQKKFADFGTDFIIRKNDQYFLDLQKIIYRQLESMGIISGNIEDMAICTRDNSDIFYSYRQQNERQNYKVFAGMIGSYEKN